MEERNRCIQSSPNQIEITPEKTRRAVRAILALARLQRHLRSPQPIWLNREVSVKAERLLSYLPPIHSSDKAAQEEEEIDALLPLLTQLGCDWEGWAARCDQLCGPSLRIWQPFQPIRPMLCIDCGKESDNGWLSLDRPLQFRCKGCHLQEKQP